MLSEKKSILIVDDESAIRESLRMILGRIYEVAVAEDGTKALNLIEQAAHGGGASNGGLKFVPDIVLLDVMMPGVDGIGVLTELSQKYPQIPVVMLTASNTVRTAVEAMKIGAADYLNKPFDVDELMSLIEETLTKGSSGRSAPSSVSTFSYRRPGAGSVKGDFGSIVGAHPVMQELYYKIKQVAARDTTILITGESGTGKELVAREIHQRGPRQSGPFVAINCAAIPETLIESELFGHEKGAFTHATERRIGQFELANGGTLFLDEIGELSLSMQVKLLRFLQDQEFYRVGQSKPIRVDVRILTATNKNLEMAIQQGTFRQDLYYRINVIKIDVPALRSRCEDVPLLVNAFLEKLSPLYAGRRPQISSEVIEVFKRYPWPGNVRELENVVESLLALTTSATIELADVPQRLRSAVEDRSNGNGGAASNFEEAEKKFETEMILNALEHCNYIQTKAAEMLGISRRILKYKMDKLGIPTRAEAREGRLAKN